LLPQTQCGQCGYPGCHPYAEAIANEGVEINLCPPGGEAVMVALSDLLDREPVALEQEQRLPALALIDEQSCIGCTLCIQACPVDAILGAAKQMHTVLKKECTGCELCLPPCPVDCIIMVPIEPTLSSWIWPEPGSTRAYPTADSSSAGNQTAGNQT
ncbi:MAG: electron transport complex subunit RsxB, partial [Gammaproteobacteria bacterium]|nr:electron transport complex subunit RsxB [Gammaproteobacteria bacterium]